MLSSQKHFWKVYGTDEMQCGKVRVYSFELNNLTKWGNIIASKSAKFRVQSSFLNPMVVVTFFSSFAVLRLEQFSFFIVR